VGRMLTPHALTQHFSLEAHRRDGRRSERLPICPPLPIANPYKEHYDRQDHTDERSNNYPDHAH
jgi:hypothetical protein